MMTDNESAAESLEERESLRESPGIGGFPQRLREAIGMNSLRGFSRDCKLSEATLRSYLSGETYPTLDRLEQIAGAAGMSPITLAFGGDNDGRPSPDTLDKLQTNPELLGWACLFILASQAAGAVSAKEIGEHCWRIAKGLANSGENDDLARAVIDVGRHQLARLQQERGKGDT
ncbi:MULTISPECIES: helix-turn-helix domain-containing protein [Pseudomonas]|uniref:helix-turn-helix domain-containing protein n=1 Tax=Pseudomonas TaxID=286 RepID=UPI001F08A816|nr:MULTISPECIES: helix-turn-helix transcriptional regulator [Pseudomonas]